MKNAIARESRKYFALLVILFFSLILEIWILVLVALKHQLVVNTPNHKIIFIGTSLSLYSLVRNRRKTVVNIVVSENEIETTSIGSFPIIRKYSIAELSIIKLATKPNTTTTLVKICNSKGKILFYTSKDFFDIKKLLNSKSMFLNELGKI